jgi:hypothetical protein
VEQRERARVQARAGAAGDGRVVGDAGWHDHRRGKVRDRPSLVAAGGVRGNAGNRSDCLAIYACFAIYCTVA